MTETNAFIIHGAYGSPEENWFPWLENRLQENGVQTFVPDFPTPEGQKLANWMDVFDRYSGEVNEETIMVGHSLGPAFILNLLERGIHIRAAFLVSGFAGLLGDEKFDSINRSFVDREFDFSTIRSNCQEFILYHSPDDPYVPMENAEELEIKLDAELRVIDGAGHFNKDAGYDRFPLLWNDINALL